MTQDVTTIAFDADDTLWHNERFFRLTQSYFAQLLADYTDQETLMSRLLEAERRNLGHYGYGIKGFTLSMVETAIEVTQGTVPASVISEILASGREMLRHPVEVLPYVHETLTAAKANYKVLLITKGDLLDQERKIAQSGLGDYFDGIEIVSDKTPATYQTAFARHGARPGAGVMVGDSMRSDVLPMLQAGGWGVFVPHGTAWEIEHAEPPVGHDRYLQIEHLGQLLPALGLAG